MPEKLNFQPPISAELNSITALSFLTILEGMYSTFIFLTVFAGMIMFFGLILKFCGLDILYSSYAGRLEGFDSVISLEVLFPSSARRSGIKTGSTF